VTFDVNGPPSSVIDFIAATDHRGDLSAIEFEQHLPFRPSRFFAVSNVGSSKIRGEHAHFKCQQVLVALHGSLYVKLDDGVSETEYCLHSANVGLYVPRMVWGSQYGFTKDAVLGVFASDPYDPADYIRDYEIFKNQFAREALH
jgi:dTDP-4-dehydrorhamnose 3,5-epimerase-like enzyme